MDAVFRTRFAPSPTGLLHLGNAASALDGWHRARAAGGQFLLRIEDIDTARARPELIQAIIDDLHWLGIDWDGPVRVQSAHLPDYRAALDRLAARGLLYPCFCTRADIAASASAPHAAPDGSRRYPGTCARLDPARRAALLETNQPHALRLDMEQAKRIAGPLTRSELGVGRIPCNPGAFGDVVLARKDAPASYHLCVTHDDTLQGISLVTRGLDLAPASDVQRLLQALLGWPEPDYAHHALLCDANGRRLAKRDHAASLRGLREAGFSPAAARAQAEAQAGGMAKPG